MNNLDDIFKSKLDQGGLEYQESYWNDMEGLIEADKRKKRRWFFLLSSLLVLLVGSISTYFIGMLNPSAPASMAAKTETKSESGKRSEASVEATLPESRPNETKSLSFQAPEVHSIPVPRKNTALKENKIFEIPSTSLTNTNNFENTFNLNIPIEDDKINLQFSELKPTPHSPIQLEILYSHRCEHCQFHGINKPKKWHTTLNVALTQQFLGRTQMNSLIQKPLNSQGFTAGILWHQKHWGIQTGIDYLRYRENNFLPSKITEYSYDTSYNLINAYFSRTPKGTRIALLGRQIDTIGTDKQVMLGGGYWQIQTLQIPILLNYQTQFKHLNFQCFVGLNTGFIVQRSGNITIEKQGLYQSSQLKTETNLRQTMLQSQFGFAVAYPIYKNWQVQASYRFYQSHSSLFKDKNSHLMRQSMGLGLQWQIN